LDKAGSGDADGSASDLESFPASCLDAEAFLFTGGGSPEVLLFDNTGPKNGSFGAGELGGCKSLSDVAAGGVTSGLSLRTMQRPPELILEVHNFEPMS
jgi:hypothetical protein